MDKAALIKQISYFEPLSEKDVSRLAQASRMIRANRGDAIFHIDEPAEGLYYLVRGKTRAVRYSPDGRELVIREFEPGETFDEVGALDGSVNPSSCYATEDGTVVLLLPTPALTRIIEEYPEIDYRIMKGMAGKLRFAMAKMNQLALMDVKGRLALHLLEHTGESGTLEGISQEGLAAQLGTVRQVLGRALSEFQREGLIRVERGRIEVIDREALRRFSSG